MLVGRVFSVADPTAVAEGAGVLAAFGTSVVIVACSSLGRIGPKGREGTPMRKMIPTTTYGARGFCLPCKFQEVQLYIPFPPIKREIVIYHRRAMQNLRIYGRAIG